MSKPRTSSLSSVRPWRLALLAATSTLAACASIWGIDEPNIDLFDGGSSDGGALDGTIDGGGAGADGAGDVTVSDARPGDAAAPDSSASDASDAAPDAAVCGATPNPNAGMFVASVGSDVSTCGSAGSPCQTIQYGVARAHASNRAFVYVAAGAYAEAIALVAGVTVWGGWEILATDGGYAWSGTCSDAGGVVTIQPSSGNITVTASSIGGTAGLQTLTILSEPQAQVAAGESLYGVFASGSNTTLEIVDVDITTGNGGNGPPGYDADGGAAGGVACAVGDGGPGEPNGPDGGGADAGVMTATGYEPVVGSAGGEGIAGANGRAADAGTCVTCVTCSGTIGCTTTVVGTSCGTAGATGCGGGGGNGGGGGGGGGSSFAVFVAGANVSVVGGTLTAGNGGEGGPGGTGGPGGPGTTGATGQNATGCAIACGNNGILSCGATASAAGQGSAGTTGGSGSVGGPGGGGSGGWSYAVVNVGPPAVTVSGTTTLVHGNFGASPGGGAPGQSGNIY